ncbi:hAT family C-terminal dimerization region [Phytophthora infestans]|uniref:HAT family C-terminal dimerization region n=1 Tax=Phytophthora infestans TaxID=4787 RepID=A0A8S9UXX4_PHYIN|nr:hAT family C-terminal dimerization region [Phytophthora infestans]
MQQRLHPDFKNPENSLNAVVKMLYKEKEMSEDAITVFVSSVNEAVKTRLRTLMEKVVDPVASDMVRRQHSAEDDPPLISGIRARFENRATQRPFPTQPDRVSQELRNWEIDQTEMRANEDVLAFWMRMEHSGGYSILPRVAKVLFALPSSSAQIERDFSVCGEMVTSQRASLSNENVDMCAFLNRNEAFVDIAQCESIPDDELDSHIPQCVSYVMEATPRDDEDEMILDLFSQASVEEEEKGV